MFLLFYKFMCIYDYFVQIMKNIYGNIYPGVYIKFF